MRRRTFLCGALGAGWLAGQGRGRQWGALAYMLADGLWARDLPEGAPLRVAAGTDLAVPRISPSGAWISYHRGETTWVAPRAGWAAHEVAKGASVWRSERDELALDGDQALDGEQGLSFYGPANGWTAPLRSIAGASLPVVFSPDGRELAFARRTRDGMGLLRRAAIEGGAARVVVSSHGDALIPYAWVGGQILYWLDPGFSASLAADGLELYRVPAAGGDPQSLGVKTLLHGDFLAPSPDGRRLAAADGFGRESWSNKRLRVIDRAEGTSRYLTDERTAAICPAWSPDGSRLAYVALPEGLDRGEGPERRFLGKRRIWIADAAGGSAPVQLTYDDRYRDEEPAWLDASHLLFCRIEHAAGDAKSIWRMDDRGGDLTRIAGPLAAGDTFEGEGWFGYYGTIDWRASMDYHRVVSSA